MNYGILNEEVSRQLFEEINKRLRCKQCQNERTDFCDLDKKHNDHYSNIFPGFSSEVVLRPIDILIVAEAHGGGDEKDFRPQMELKFEVDRLGKYYLQEDLKNFHQQEIRNLLSTLTQSGKIWVFTDLIKCFVRNKNGSHNKNIAIQHCRKYLDKQIEILQPQKVLSLGKTVSQYFGLQKYFRHGDDYKYSMNDYSVDIVFSYFPSRNTADLWVQNRAWEPIFSKLT